MTSDAKAPVKLKVVVVGDAAVGKTSLALKFTRDVYKDNYTFTIGGSYCTRSLYIDNKKITFNIWDTAGTERFKSVVPFYLRDADVALVTYDITEQKSFEDINQWMRLLQESAPETVKCALVGNKCDLDSQRQITKQLAEAFADEHGLYFLETSAKTGHNIQKLFIDIGSIFVDGPKPQRYTRSTSTVSVKETDGSKRNKCC